MVHSKRRRAKINLSSTREALEACIGGHYYLTTRRRLTALTTEIVPLQTCRKVAANRCAPYTINCMVIPRTTSIPITRTPTGDASNATSPRKVMSEMEDTTMQKVGMRDDKEKEMYEPYTSRQRYYEQLYQRVKRSRSGVYAP